MVQDGALPELSPDALLRDVALRATCWSIRPTERPEAVTALRGPDPEGLDADHHEVTGTVERVAGGRPPVLVLRTGTLHLLAGPVTHLADGGDVTWPADFWAHGVGVRATAICRLEVMAPYESEPGAPGTDGADIRREWVVRRVRVRHRSLDPVPGQEGMTAPGRILRVDDVDRMRRWDDDTGRDYVDYLVDLTTTGS